MTFSKVGGQVISSTSLPLAIGSNGPAVRDLTARLRAAGFDPGTDTTDFSEATRSAVLAFQSSRGLDEEGICDRDTWVALVEAGFAFGDRLLYLTQPMLRGDDVADLQLRLGALGFDAGRVDGIFGPMTRDALLEFQRNVGLVPDEVCGPDTVAALARLQPRGGTTSVAGVRERHRLRTRQHQGLSLNIALAHLGDADELVGIVATELSRAGARVAVFAAESWSLISPQVNAMDAELCLAVSTDVGPVCEVAYFETTGFHSVGGHQLAHLIGAELPSSPLWPLVTVSGKRIPILRETRPPAVAIRIGPAAMVSEQHNLVGAALARSVTRWSDEPC